MKKSLMIGVAVLLFLTELAQAGDSRTIGVSCTIPAIPGVNAPALVEEKTVNVNLEALSPQPTVEQDELAPATIQQDSEKQATSTNGKTSLLMVKTLYSR